MKKFLKYLLCAALLFAVFFIFRDLGSQRHEAEIIRKLSGLRLSLTLYRLKEKSLPTDFGEVIKKGYLEGIPFIKLRWRPGSERMKHYSSFKVENSGSWAYVNDPKDKDFGLVYIDSSGKDPKGRDWSLF